MKRILAVLVAAGLAALAGCLGGNDGSDARQRLAEGFASPPDSAKPWCYWWWQNGHADKKSITADLEAMARLGFGGVLMSDARGYWDDDDHVFTAPAEIEVMSDEWKRLVLFSIQECHRLGLKFTMNVATCGGSLKGPWKVGADAPKRLMCRVYAAGAEFEKPDFPYWKDITEVEVVALASNADEIVAKGWFEAGDGTRTQQAHTRNSSEKKKWIPVAKSTDRGAAKYRVRFGYTVIPGHEYDIDVLDPYAIERHFNRFTGAIMDEAGSDLVGIDKTISHVYSVSWEGIVPQWSPSFAEDFNKFAGYPIDEGFLVLAGFVPAGTDPDKFMSDFRRARNDMFRENFYGTLKRLAASRGCGMFSENGGPWRRDPEIFMEADQLAYLSLNEMPQGEFWVNESGGSTQIFGTGDNVDRFFTRGPVSAAHVYGKNRASAESFTHMTRHWSMSPSVLRTPIDKAFADGINHVVWHTYSLSPEKFGVPGNEYFAGTHINGNVTWHDEAGAFIQYLQRCEFMLQAGAPVVDIAVRSGNSTYAGWGRFRDCTPDGIEIPSGYNYDMVNDDEWSRSVVKEGWRIMASGMKYPVKLPEKPDLEGPFAFAHRRVSDCDVYFVQGRFKSKAIFRASGKRVEVWDAVTGSITPLESEETVDGRTKVWLDLSEVGSAIVVLSPARGVAKEAPCKTTEKTAEGPWDVSFAYHRIGHERHLPVPRKMGSLRDWTESRDDDLRYFSGTATYAATVTLEEGRTESAAISLGRLPTGVAHVFVNGVDCGTVWCYPWEAAIPPGTLRTGANELLILYTNNWVNRLIGDCLLEPDDRVTTSCLQYLKSGRVKENGKRLNEYSGYSGSDELQPSGLLGPVKIIMKSAN